MSCLVIDLIILTTRIVRPYSATRTSLVDDPTKPFLVFLNLGGLQLNANINICPSLFSFGTTGEGQQPVFWATVYKTVRPVLSDRSHAVCLSCL